MEQLSGLDAAFVYLDSRNCADACRRPACISADVRQASISSRSATHIAGCLDSSPIFRRRLAQVPLRLGRPFWVDDPHFDLDLHLQHSALPGIGRLGHGCGSSRHRMFSRPLDPERPLWHLTFVSGLDTCSAQFPPGSFAVISRIHHAAADGLGTLDMFNAVWSTEPRRASRKRTVMRRGRPLRSRYPERAWGYSSTASVARSANPARALQLGRRAFCAGGWARGASSLPVITMRRRCCSRRRAVPSMCRSARAAASMQSRSRWTIFARSAAAVEGTTVNDVVLAVCSGGLRRYLQAYGRTCRKKTWLRWRRSRMRHKVQEGGNRVSAMLIPLEVGTRNPVERLRRIHAHAVASKAYTDAVGAATLADTSRFVPYSLATAAAGLYSGLHLARYHRPPFNLVITNVPGPRVPLYLGTAKLLEGLRHGTRARRPRD
jgi:diacylglycerol O-acyltransferase / wax synthase